MIIINPLKSKMIYNYFNSDFFQPFAFMYFIIQEKCRLPVNTCSAGATEVFKIKAGNSRDSSN